MRLTGVLFLLCWCVFFMQPVEAVSLKLLKTIGDDREDYGFFIISDAVMAPSGDIYVLDGKGEFISRFDKNGKFIKTIGKKGQGPGDFSFPAGLDLFGKRLFVNDVMNRRIFSCDLELANYRYYPMNRGAAFNGEIIALPGQRFLGVPLFSQKELKRILIIDETGAVQMDFFDRFPIELEVTPRMLDLDKSADHAARHVIISGLTKPIIAADPKREKYFITFMSPDNPLVFYVCSAEGKEFMRFSHPIDRKYRFFDLPVKAQTVRDLDEKKYPDQHFEPTLIKPTVYKNYYLVQLQLSEYRKKKEVSREHFLLVFNQDGSFRGEVKLLEDEYFRGLYENDLALVSGDFGEQNQLRIYKITW